MLYLALAVAVFLAAIVGLAMCRLAARSDRLQAIALAEWAVSSKQDKRRQSGAGQPSIEAYRKAS